MSDKLSACFGKCLNGGVCANGECVCIDNYKGTFCEEYGNYHI
jgi:hypothetical protein